MVSNSGGLNSESIEYNPEYKIKFKPEITGTTKTGESKLKKVALAVANIQKSIDWNAMDLRIANRRLQSADNPKVLVKNRDTKELVGYAIIVPENKDERPCWYISQIAVKKELHRSGIGREVMHTIFEKARENRIDKVYLEADSEDDKLMRFYRSFAKKVTVEEIVMGSKSFGNSKTYFYYKIDPE